MRLEIMGQTDAGVWDDLVQKSVNGSLYHTWKWLNILEKHSDTRLFPLVFFDTRENKPFGAVPLFYREKLGMRMVFSPPPGSSVRLGPVLMDKGYKQHKFELAYLDFQEHVESFIKNLKSNYTLITTNPGLSDIRPFSWAGYQVSPLYTYKLDLEQGEETLWKNLSSSLRWEIKQAQKNGLSTIECRDNTGINYIHDSLHRRYQDQRLNLNDRKDYLLDLFKAFSPSALKVCLAMRDDKIVNATMYILYKNTVTGLIGGARNMSHDLEASHYLDWEVITHAIRNGYKWYEEFGANTRHLCNSKSKYNPKPVLYYQIRKSGLLGAWAEKGYRLLKRKII
ncbi:MAG: peptidoglycan bridge formation glycyltransferase FemA/FemB family protein [Dehalococcoidales bacterium]|nr:peptidoglycan bridge formation glycyltransferase FemA/FemB family protein [Dehalococcoidales bacterium]